MPLDAMPHTRGIFSMDGTSVLLTGASAGIGRRFASVLGGAGARVIGLARSAAILESMADEIPGFVPVPADLADLDALPDVMSRVLDAVGHVDVLINNAGVVSANGRAATETRADISATINVNLVAPMLLAQAVFPGMKARGSGSIVNVTSIVAQVGIARYPQAAYAATKGGLEALTRAWAVQWGRYGIRVNAIAPGFFETEMNQAVVADEPVQEWIRANALIPRAGRPDDIDGALLFLASDAGRYVTGQTIVIDGGWVAQ